jgi:hypothetical protein
MFFYLYGKYSFIYDNTNINIKILYIYNYFSNLLQTRLAFI